MDLEKSKVLLKKITSLHESATAFGSDLSALERDLLLQYIREFYESIRTESSETIAHNLPTEISINAAPATSSRSADQATVRTSVKEESVTPEVTPPESPSLDPEPIPDASQPEPVKVVEEVRPVVTNAPIEGGFEELFEDPAVSDVSSKFSQAPIADIGRALGLNDRILMINTLFGGSQQRFNEVVSELNDSPSFMAAKAKLISGVAKEFEWNNPKVLIQAKRFVNIVRRRHQ